MSAYTDIIAQVRSNLGDADGDKYTDAHLAYAFEEALQKYSRCHPLLVSATLEVQQTSFMMTLSSLSKFYQVTHVNYPYSEDLQSKPDSNRLDDWFVSDTGGNGTLISRNTVFTDGEYIQIWYSKRQTVAGYGDDEATSIHTDGALVIAIGATAFAALTRYLQLSEVDGVSQSQMIALRTTYERWLEKFETALKNIVSKESSPTGPLPATGWKLPTPDQF